MPVLKNAKHEAVLQAFLADEKRIGWRAYKKVYAKSSQRASETAWSRLLTKAEFAGRLQELLSEVAAAGVAGAVMDLEEVLAELSKLGRSSIKNCLVRGDDSGEVIASIEDLPDEHAAAIQELTVETYLEGKGDDAREVKRVKVKLHSKPQALSELRRHHEPQKHELAGKDGGPIEVEDKTPATELEIARRIAFALEQGARAAAKPAKPAKPKGTRK